MNIQRSRLRHGLSVTNKALFLFVLIASCFVLFASAEAPTEEHPFDVMGDRLQGPMAGGWSPSKLDDPMVVEAAQFCLRTLQDDKSLQDKYSFSVLGNSAPTVLQASQQVVAGMNFRLTVLIQNDDHECVGAFRATVYNHFGNLSVTEWDDEVSCSEAKMLLEQQRDSGHSN